MQGALHHNNGLSAALVLGKFILLPPRRGRKHLQTKIPLRQIIFAFNFVQTSPTIRVAPFPLKQSQKHKNLAVGALVFEAEGTSAVRRRHCLDGIHHNFAFAFVPVRGVAEGASFRLLYVVKYKVKVSGNRGA